MGALKWEDEMNWNGKRVLVTGGNGFLGHAVVEQLQKLGVKELVVAQSKEFDLTKETEVARLFADFSPDVVFHLAGLVGGILPNQERPAEFFYQNLMMGTLVLHYARLAGAEKFVAAGAGCGYPEHAPIPLKETSFWDGLPQKESTPYSLAKRLLTIQAEAYYRQYGFVSLICVPGNLYGPWDNFNLHDAHVIPALVRKFVEAAQTNAARVRVWGTGRASRDFVYVEDVALGMIRAVEVYTKNEVVNISSGVETSVREICGHLAEITGFTGEIEWDSTKPDGQLRRWFDVAKSRQDLQYVPHTAIRAGLEKTVEWFKAVQDSANIRK